MHRADALCEQTDGFVDVRQDDPHRDQPRRVLAAGRLFAQEDRQSAQRRLLGCLSAGFFGSEEALDDLDCPHHGHGVEEVHADHVLRLLDLRRDVCDGAGGGVAGEHGVGLAVLVDVREDLSGESAGYRLFAMSSCVASITKSAVRTSTISIE